MVASGASKCCGGSSRKRTLSARRWTMRKTRVLIVDADPNLSGLAGMILQGSGLYDVMIVNQAHRASPTIINFQPDLMLLGNDLPDKSGRDTAAAVDSRLDGVPVLFLTGLVNRKDAGTKRPKSRGRRSLAKPVEPAMLLDAVAGLICGPVFR